MHYLLASQIFKGRRRHELRVEVLAGLRLGVLCLISKVSWFQVKISVGCLQLLRHGLRISKPRSILGMHLILFSSLNLPRIEHIPILIPIPYLPHLHRHLLLFPTRASRPLRRRLLELDRRLLLGFLSCGEDLILIGLACLFWLVHLHYLLPILLRQLFQHVDLLLREKHLSCVQSILFLNLSSLCLFCHFFLFIFWFRGLLTPRPIRLLSKHFLILPRQTPFTRTSQRHLIELGLVVVDIRPLLILSFLIHLAASQSLQAPGTQPACRAPLLITIRILLLNLLELFFKFFVELPVDRFLIPSPYTVPPDGRHLPLLVVPIPLLLGPPVVGGPLPIPLILGWRARFICIHLLQNRPRPRQICLILRIVHVCRLLLILIQDRHGLLSFEA